ncbi:hypothetical protein [Beijerinckia sp. L45]|uniref:hypothetical protein n=1 Tax=Beijerinckia sp. L45 TaxID=1641855 RepID=UPI00131CAB26|nr:hypothetical protein [Beijerinckia sp. L45]
MTNDAKLRLEVVRPACHCIEEIDAAYGESHKTAVLTTLIGATAIVATRKRDEHKRGKPISALASFCPFCGVKYAAEDERSVDPGERVVRV